MAHIEIVPHDQAEGVVKREYDSAMQRAGRIWHIVSVQSRLPEVMRDSLRLYASIMFGPSPLSRVHREMLAVVTSQALDCEY